MLQKCMSQQQGTDSLQIAVEVCEYFEKTLTVAEQGQLSFHKLFKRTGDPTIYIQFS